MTPPTIFCPNSHLILSATRCTECDWQRPPLGQVGEAAWGPLMLKAGLGGLGRHVFVGPAAAQGVLALPLSNHEIVGVGLADGKERWRIATGGLVTRHLLRDGDSIWMALSDEGSLETAGPGQLARLDPLTGKVSVVWQASGHQLSSPACSETHLVVSTTKAELVALRRRGPAFDVAWHVPLNTFWMAASPQIVDGTVLVCDGLAMQGEGRLKAFDLQTGKPRWNKPTDGLIQHPLALAAGQVIFQNGKKRLTAWDAASGGESWSLDIARFYTPPVSGDGRVFMVVRGNADKNSPNYYQLKTLDAASGKLLWDAPLPARALAAPLWANGQVYVASEDGRLFGFNAQDGAALFVQQIGGEEDPPRTALVVADGVLVAGTLNGRLTGLRVDEPHQQLEAPEAYQQRGEFESAAAAYALQGSFESAASLYADPLRDIPKALVLYEHGNLIEKAAELCAQHGLLAEAEKYYQQVANLPKQAEMRLKRGDELGAANLLEKAGQFANAASLFEKAGDFHHALGLYQQLNDEPAVLRVHHLMPPDFQRTADMLALLLKQGKVTEAAEEAEAAGLLEKAIELFQQANRPIRELDALLALAQKKEEAWVFERIAELAHEAGRFLEEAQALERLGYPRRTAEAYYAAAEKLEHAFRPDPNEIGALYQKAQSIFTEAGFKKQAQECRQKVILHFRLPNIVIDSVPRKAFIEGEFNELELIIYNNGKDVALKMHFHVARERFETADASSVLQLGNLAAGEHETQTLLIRPKDGQVGDTVPLSIAWHWQDRNGNAYQDNVEAKVPVRRRDETRPDVTPQVINIGTFVQGNQHVGDSVDVHRDGGGVRVSSESASPQPIPQPKICPNCKRPNDADANFCAGCRQPLTT